MVPVYADLTLTPATLTFTSMTTGLVLVPSKVAMSLGAGTTSPVQFAGVDQLLSEPPPSQTGSAKKESTEGNRGRSSGVKSRPAVAVWPKLSRTSTLKGLGPGWTGQSKR